MISATGNATVDAAVNLAEGLRQSVCNAPTSTQAQMVTATATYFTSVLSAKLAAGQDIGNEIAALENLGKTV
jgi:hypothetical protein